MADFNDSPVEGIATDRPLNPGAQAVAALVHELFRSGGSSDVVLVAFISGATIQVIGLLAIVTHYLFPREEAERA
ncbi:MAG TPA: hypothetical protein K8V54_00675 [Corynebacterium kroppenstedtii]|nr:hypothetical protein [Corynebacterium kroppenstedtii]